MQKLSTLLLLFLTFTLPSLHTVQAASHFDDWHTGDLIFHESLSAQAAAIRAVTGSRYTHMGIVHLTQKGPYVIEAGQTVTETPLKTFIARGSNHDYAVYRVNGLTQANANAMVKSTRDYLGRPYDIFFRLEPTAIYCSELPFYAFRAAGITLGKIERLGDLGMNSQEGQAIFLARWQQHPDCKNTDRASCWATVQQQEIVTPVSIANDDKVTLVYSTFSKTP